MNLRIANKMLRYVKRGCYGPRQLAKAEKVADCHIVYHEGKPFMIMDHRPTVINVGFGAWLENAKEGN